MKLNIVSSLFIGIIVALLISAASIYSYFVPYSIVQELQQSIKENNALSADQYIDFTRVKESFRRQLLRSYKDNSFYQAEDEGCNTVSSVFKNEVIELALNQLISLENLRLMLSGQAPKLFDTSKSAMMNSADIKLNESTKQYLTIDTFAQTINLSNGQSMKFLYWRYGLMAWRLSEIHLSNLEAVVEFIKSKQVDTNTALKIICVVKAPPSVTQSLPQIKSSAREPKQLPNTLKEPKPTLGTELLPRHVRHHLTSALARACQLENSLRARQGFLVPSRLCTEY